MVNTPLTDGLKFHWFLTQRSADSASHSGESETVFVSLIIPCSTRTRSRTLPLTRIFKAMGDIPVSDISAQHYLPGFRQQPLEASRSPGIPTQEPTRKRRLRQLQQGYERTDFLTCGSLTLATISTNVGAAGRLLPELPYSLSERIERTLGRSPHRGNTSSQCGFSKRCEIAIFKLSATMKGWARKRKKRLGTSQTELVCNVEMGRCLDEERRMRASALSSSRISSIMTNLWTSPLHTRSTWCLDALIHKFPSVLRR